jgi:hypothetical protein
VDGIGLDHPATLRKHPVTRESPICQQPHRIQKFPDGP